jgi:hypothetical protein
LFSNAFFFFKTEKEDQTAITGQEHDTQQHQTDSNYYDDGPSIMPASENFAGNQDNWGASATDGWGTANAGATGANTNEWNAPSAPTTGVTGSW